MYYLKDILINNILVFNHNTKLTGGEQLHGFLIDLDYAVRGNDKSGLLERTGILEFMAIYTLEGTSRHIYRRDLESFLYVIIWFSIYNPEEILKRWFRGNWEAIVAIK